MRSFVFRSRTSGLQPEQSLKSTLCAAGLGNLQSLRPTAYLHTVKAGHQKYPSIG